jgi:hypothetical protein
MQGTGRKAGLPLERTFFRMQLLLARRSRHQYERRICKQSEKGGLLSATHVGCRVQELHLTPSLFSWQIDKAMHAIELRQDILARGPYPERVLEADKSTKPSGEDPKGERSRNE